MSRIALRAQPVRDDGLRPVAGVGQAAQPAVLDQERVLELAAARDARVPGDGVAGFDPAVVPDAVALTRNDLELALAVGDRPTLVVLAPRAGMSGLGVGLVARAQDVAVGRADAARGEHARLDRPGGLPGRAHRVGERPAAGDARRRGVQAAALGDDDGHREARDRRADAPADGGSARRDRRRRRSGRPRTRPRSPVRRAREPAARSRARRAATSQQRALERAAASRASPASRSARPAEARGAGRRARRRRRCRRPRDRRSRAAVAGCAREIARGLARSPPRPANQSTSSRRRPRADRSCSASMRGRSTLVVRASGVAGRDHEPHRARRRARLDAIREPGGEPGHGAGRGQDGRRRAEIGEQGAHLRDLRGDLRGGRAFGCSERRDDDREGFHVAVPVSTRMLFGTAEQHLVGSSAIVTAANDRYRVQSVERAVFVLGALGMRARRG